MRLDLVQATTFFYYAKNSGNATQIFAKGTSFATGFAGIRCSRLLVRRLSPFIWHGNRKGTTILHRGMVTLFFQKIHKNLRLARSTAKLCSFFRGLASLRQAFVKRIFFQVQFPLFRPLLSVLLQPGGGPKENSELSVFQCSFALCFPCPCHLKNPSRRPGP